MTSIYRGIHQPTRKEHHMKKPTLFCTLGGVTLALALAAPAWAGDIIDYPNDGTSTLTTIVGDANSLGPSGSADSDSPPNYSTYLTYNVVALDSTAGGAVTGDVFGAINFHDATALQTNEVDIHDSVGKYVFGAWLNYTASTAAGVTVSGNYVLVYPNTTSTIGSKVVGGEADNNSSGDATASGNTVNINSGTVSSAVYGGKASSHADGTATADSNSVGIYGGVLKSDAYGGLATLGTSSSTTTATNNTVTLDIGGEVDGSIYGGFSDATASTNHVVITGGTVKKDIYAAAANTSATGNDVTISGTPTLGTGLYGGDAPTSTGNTLYFHSTGLSVGDLSYFQTLHFYLPTTAAPGTPLLTVTTASGSGSANLNGATIQVDLDGAGGPVLHVGDKFTLIRAVVLNATGFTPTTGTLGGFGYTLTTAPSSLPDTTSATDLVLTLNGTTPRTPTATSAPAIGYGGLIALGLLFTVFAGVWLRGARR
jgi:hypothetical protein